MPKKVLIANLLCPTLPQKTHYPNIGEEILTEDISPKVPSLKPPPHRSEKKKQWHSTKPLRPKKTAPSILPHLLTKILPLQNPKIPLRHPDCRNPKSRLNSAFARQKKHDVLSSGRKYFNGNIKAKKQNPRTGHRETEESEHRKAKEPGNNFRIFTRKITIILWH